LSFDSNINKKIIMKNNLNRRDFVRTAAIGGIGLGLAGNVTSLFGKSSVPGGKIGIIGLDTSHSVAFTKALNNPNAGPEYGGFKIVAAYPKGSNDIKSSVERIPSYIEEVKKQGVEIVNSIDDLIKKVDFVLLETNDGRLHFEQAIPVLKAGKRMFIDKPIAASLSDAIAIFDAAKHYNVPIFSSSSLRYITGTKEIAEGKIGKVIGADTFSPCSLEKTHPDLFWYGIHGVEILFTIMGIGCKTVVRVTTPDTDMAIGTWQDNRIGTFRGLRAGKSGYGGNVFGEKGILALGNFGGYDPLLLKILEFFNTGVVPVRQEETLDILAFMQAADESKLKGGVPVDIEKIRQKAIQKAKKMSF
jgi:predicted dehydrogenase